MKTIFGLFETYEEAAAAVDVLIEAGASVDDMNALVQAKVAKTAMDVDLSRAGVAVTEEVGERELHGLDRLVAGEQAVTLPGVGDLYAAGEMATFIAKAAQKRRAGDQGLEPALREFGIAKDMASTYFTGIERAGWLLFIRTDDEEALRLLPILREHTGKVTTVGGGA